MNRIATTLGALLLAVACSSTASSEPAPDAGPSYAGSCATLASRCHPYDTVLAKECHDLGHAGDISKCGPRLGECLAECPEREAGAGLPDDAGADGASDAGPDPSCVTLCDCMKQNCSAVANYPFADEGVCYRACATYTEPERACFSTFCGQAIDAGVRDHACDHATGKLGAAECP